MLACWLPARQPGARDPSRTLRWERATFTPSVVPLATPPPFDSNNGVARESNWPPVRRWMHQFRESTPFFVRGDADAWGVTIRGKNAKSGLQLCCAAETKHCYAAVTIA